MKEEVFGVSEGKFGTVQCVTPNFSYTGFVKVVTLSEVSELPP